MPRCQAEPPPSLLATAAGVNSIMGLPGGGDALPKPVDGVAEALRLPRWTLQRRLAEARLSFSDVEKKLRRS